MLTNYFCTPPPAVSITPDRGMDPPETGLSQFFLGIISYQLQTFPLGPVLQSHAPEQHAAARHNWGWYRSLTATNLKSFKPHPSRLLSLSSISSLRPCVCVRTWSSTKWESVTAVAPSTPRSLQFSQTKTDSGVYAADALMLHWD